MHENISDRIRTTLLSISMDVTQLSEAIDAPPAELQAELKRLATSGRVHNLGSAEYPIWTWCSSSVCAGPVDGRRLAFAS
jgi:hypothetical protein